MILIAILFADISNVYSTRQVSWRTVWLGTNVPAPSTLRRHQRSVCLGSLVPDVYYFADISNVYNTRQLSWWTVRLGRNVPGPPTLRQFLRGICVDSSGCRSWYPAYNTGKLLNWVPIRIVNSALTWRDLSVCPSVFTLLFTRRTDKVGIWK